MEDLKRALASLPVPMIEPTMRAFLSDALRAAMAAADRRGVDPHELQRLLQGRLIDLGATPEQIGHILISIIAVAYGTNILAFPMPPLAAPNPEQPDA